MNVNKIQTFVNCEKHNLADDYSKCKECHWEITPQEANNSLDETLDRYKKEFIIRKEIIKAALLDRATDEVKNDPSLDYRSNYSAEQLSDYFSNTDYISDLIAAKNL